MGDNHGTIIVSRISSFKHLINLAVSKDDLLRAQNAKRHLYDLFQVPIGSNPLIVLLNQQ